MGIHREFEKHKVHFDHTSTAPMCWKGDKVETFQVAFCSYICECGHVNLSKEQVEKLGMSPHDLGQCSNPMGHCNEPRPELYKEGRYRKGKIEKKAFIIRQDGTWF